LIQKKLDSGAKRQQYNDSSRHDNCTWCGYNLGTGENYKRVKQSQALSKTSASRATAGNKILAANGGSHSWNGGDDVRML